MNQYYAYIRVSTARQGEKGVSLTEQRDAIERYANAKQMTISEWFEERETAAKFGRPVFQRMLSLLAKGKVRGVIIHKIDRSARNLRDWARLIELTDDMTEVHFANESIDVNSRGGRLSADIQAVVAADYIRNLREETKKGFYGRLKQGLYPMRAPVGYLDTGGGNPKEIDPVRGPLVRQVFELYATGQHSLDSVRLEMSKRGLVMPSGGPLRINAVSVILNNPFYAGIIRIKKTGETFEGIHQPLVSQTLFDQVQRVLKDKTQRRIVRHDFLFRGMFQCAGCGRRLIGERQKGHVYYRCHSRACRGVSQSERGIEAAVVHILEPLRFPVEEMKIYKETVAELATEQVLQAEELKNDAVMKLTSITERLDRLTDALIDGLIEKDTFDRRKESLLHAKRRAEEEIATLELRKGQNVNPLAEILELSSGAQQQYISGDKPEKRELLKILSSNLSLDRKNVVVELSNPYCRLANRPTFLSGAPCRDRVRTFLRGIINLNTD
jgi:DNA invertase Pin-like site-specific DNA recombinase